MTFLFLVISIPLMEEKQGETKGPEYEQYKQKVPSPLIPLPFSIAKVFRRKPVETQEKKDQ